MHLAILSLVVVICLYVPLLVMAQQPCLNTTTNFTLCTTFSFKAQCEAADNPGCCHWCPSHVHAAGDAAGQCLGNRTKCPSLSIDAFTTGAEMTAEEQEMVAWMRRLEEYVPHPSGLGTREPDGWWLKTCAGWSALMACGAIFGAGIEETVAFEEDVGVLFGSAVSSSVDYERRAVDSTCIWNFTETVPYTAIFRENLGCTLVEGLTEDELRAQDVGNVAPPPPLRDDIPWPFGELGPPAGGANPPGVDMQCVRDAVADQFADSGANPRGITIVYNDELIFEQYSDVVDKDSRLIGWSATKSVVNALIGIVVGEGNIAVFDPAPVPEWANDDRAQITTDEMLSMTSGTPWGFDPLTTTPCLFDSDGDCAHFCTDPDSFPLQSPPGTRGEYNSGSSYLLSRMANTQRAPAGLTNFEWPKRAFYDRIGAHSFYIEYQPNQHFLGGALGYATARDWARFGLLFLRDGVWIDGARVLPEGWVDYSRTGSAADPGYGRHWRLDSGRDMFFATGFRNENVYVFQSRRLVITRHAMPQPIYFGWNQGQFLDSLLACFPSAGNVTSTQSSN